MARAFTSMDEASEDLRMAFAVLRASGPASVDGSDEDLALCGIETFCAIALRVMCKTNPSKIRSEAITVEIQARMDGREVIQGVA